MKKAKKVTILRKPFAAIMATAMLFSGFTPVYADKAKTAKEIVAEMSLEQKIAQMIMPAFRYWEKEDGKLGDFPELNDYTRECIKKHGFAGTILYTENIKGTEQTMRLIDDMQTCSVSGGNLPLLVAADQEGGRVARLETGTSMSGNMSLGAINDKAITKEYAEIIGSEMNAIGINVNFAPVMDINNNPKNPVINIRSFSSDPAIVSDMGEAFIEGLHNEGIITALKHFPGHGDTETDSHTGLPTVNKSYKEIKNFELIPFMRGVEAESDMIMTAHIEYPQIEKETYTSIKSGEKIYLPATLSKTFITDILRGDMGYNGIIITDAMNMKAISENFTLEDATRLAINADVDILLMPFYMTNAEEVAKMDDYIKSIADMVKNGEIKEETITDSAEKIVDLKVKKGLLEYDGNIDEKIKNAKKILGSKAHHDRELEIAAKAVTLLKNDNNAFPASLSENEKAVVFCSSESYMPGVEYGEIILKENGVIPKNADIDVYSFDKAIFDDYKDKVKDAKYIIINDVMSSLKSIDTSQSSCIFINEALKFAKENNIPSAVMSLYLPYDVARYQNADALFAVYSSKNMPEIPTEFNGETKTYGPGCTAALCTAFNYMEPKGKLPVDIYELEDNNYSDRILYQIGYGMSYDKASDETDTPDEITTPSAVETTTETTTKKKSSSSSKSSGSSAGKASNKASSAKETTTTETKTEAATEAKTESTTDKNTSAAETKTVKLQIGNNILTINEKEVKLDQAPVISDGITFVPIRAIVEALDGKIDWDGASKTATITNKGGNKIVIAANNNKAYFDGVSKQLDTAPVIMNGRMMLPLNFVAENFGYNVDWNSSEKSITIK